MDVIATILMILGSILIIIFIVALILVIKLIQDIRAAANSIHRLASRMDKGALSVITSIFNLIRKGK